MNSKFIRIPKMLGILLLSLSKMLRSISLLGTLFDVRNVAIIGASSEPQKTGSAIFGNLMENGFSGNVFPVNPKYDEIGGVKCYHSVLDIEGPIDLAVVVLRADLVENALKQCVKIDVSYVVIISGGFSETGEEGKKMEERLREIIRGSNTRIIGPNTVGLYLPYSKLNTALTPSDRVNFPGEGKIALVSQSGALGLLMMDEMAESGTGVSAFMNLGNRIDLDESDLLEYFSSDRRTRSIMMYVESISSGRKFYNTLKGVSKKKPAVILKAGSTEESARAAMLHTGALSSNDAIFDGVLRQAGAIRAYNETELYDYAKALAYCPPLKGENIAIITTAGGAGVVSTDLLTTDREKNALKLAKFSEKTIELIQSIIVPFGSARNPVDITAEGSVEQYRKILEILVESGEADGVLAFALPQTARMDDGIVDVISEFSSKIPIVVGVIGSRLAVPLLRKFESAEIASYPSIERAVSSLKALYLYHKLRGEIHD